MTKFADVTTGQEYMAMATLATALLPLSRVLLLLPKAIPCSHSVRTRSVQHDTKGELDAHLVC